MNAKRISMIAQLLTADQIKDIMRELAISKDARDYEVRKELCAELNRRTELVAR